METRVLTPQMIFTQPQRLIVPLFQRRYVWNEQDQWEPLWKDVARVAERLLAHPKDRPQPHFLGAVVLQQVPTQAGYMLERTVIDGQQRLTTLQLLLDALHAELAAVGATQAAHRVEPLVANAEPFRSRPEDRFKVWPTNRDRPAFNAVMVAAPPVDYVRLGFTEELMVEAHQFFAQQASEWLRLAGEAAYPDRAAALETTARELLHMVVIDLGVDENAQEIFETLNDRGARLTAADLVKNFVFQRLSEQNADVEAVYEGKWKEFETAFWEVEKNVGRQLHTRSSLFLNHWLVSRTGEEVVAREVFSEFKKVVTDAHVPVMDVVEQIHRASAVYRQFITAAESPSGAIDRLGLFGYRTGVMESEVVKPLVLALLDPEMPSVPPAQFTKVLDTVESWMVRRMLTRSTTKAYNQVFAELTKLTRGVERPVLGDVVEQFLRDQNTESRYWPDDDELRTTLRDLVVYRRLGRGRLRMVLETVEDWKRGWKGALAGLGDQRITRGKHAIEHVMPQKWARHWSDSLLPGGDAERERVIHTLGNLTLLPHKLNSKVSHGPWLGDEGKRSGLQGHDVLFLNRELVKMETWDEKQIAIRTSALIELIIQIWPVPAGHRANVEQKERPNRRRKVRLPELIGAGVIQPGVPLFARSKRFVGPVATLLPTGQIDVGGTLYERPSAAASALNGHPTNGWWFFLVDPASKRSLKTIRREYNDALAADQPDEDDEDDGDDE